jgi:hypothetical protein
VSASLEGATRGGGTICTTLISMRGNGTVETGDITVQTCVILTASDPDRKMLLICGLAHPGAQVRSWHRDGRRSPPLPASCQRHHRTTRSACPGPAERAGGVTGATGVEDY